MKKVRRVLSIVFCLLMCFSVFTACKSGQPSGSESESSSGSTSQSSVESEPDSEQLSTSLKVWGAIQEASGPLDLINNFMEKNPNIKVEYMYFKNDDTGNTKLNTALMSGESVDVFINYGAQRVIPRIKGNLVEDLSPYIEKDGFSMEENFGSSYITFDDKIYALPASSIKTMVWINKSMLDKAGLPVPPEDWTWEDYAYYMTKLSESNGGILGSTTSTAWYSYTYPARGLLGSNFLYKEDGTSNLDHPAFKKSLEHRLLVQNELKVEGDMIEMVTSKMRPYVQFLTGNSAMMMATDSQLRHANNLADYPRDWQIIFANVPCYDENTDVNYNLGRYNYDFASINRRSDNKDAAWELAKFWSTEGSLDMFRYGRAPAWKKIDTTEAANFMFTDETRPLVDMDSFMNVLMDFTSDGYNDDSFVAYDQIVDIITEELQKCQLGETNVDEAMENMKTRADEEIEKELTKSE